MSNRRTKYGHFKPIKEFYTERIIKYYFLIELICKRAMIHNILFWQFHTVIFWHLINLSDISSPSIRTIITHTRWSFPYHFSHQYLEAYCAVSPFNGILIYDFIRRTRIYSICSDVSFEWQKKKEGGGGRKKRKRNWWEVFPTGKFFRHCSCGNWRYRDAVANFVLPRSADG